MLLPRLRNSLRRDFVQPEAGELGGRIIGSDGTTPMMPAAEAMVTRCPASALDHPGQKGPDRPNMGEQVDGQRTLDLAVAAFQEGWPETMPGIIDQDIQSAQCLAPLPGQRLDLLAPAQVHREAEHRAAPGRGFAAHRFHAGFDRYRKWPFAPRRPQFSKPAAVRCRWRRR